MFPLSVVSATSMGLLADTYDYGLRMRGDVGNVLPVTTG